MTPRTDLKFFPALWHFLVRMPGVAWFSLLAVVAAVRALPAFIKAVRIVLLHRRIERECKQAIADRKRDRLLNPQNYLGKDEDHFDV